MHTLIIVLRFSYQKFVKNKDLSKINAHDWNCIFGKPVVAEEVQKQSSEEVVITKALESLKRKREKNQEVCEEKSIDLEPEPVNKEKKKKKKKKRHTDLEEEVCAAPEEAINDTSAAANDEQELPKKKKKKKRKTDAEHDAEIKTSISIVIHLEESVEASKGEDEEIPKRKKKKHKKDKCRHENSVADSEPLHEQDPDSIMEKKSKKTRKDKNKEVKDDDVQECQESFAEESKIVDELPTNESEAAETAELIGTTATETSSSSAETMFAVSKKTKVKPGIEEIQTVATQFKGSNILLIPGYRNQSNKPNPI